MKKSILLLTISLGLSHAQAFDVMSYVKTYALPCAATIGISALVSKKDSMQENALLGCSLLVIGGEMVKSSETQRTLGEMNKEFESQMIDARNQARQANEERFKTIEERMGVSENKNSEAIKNISYEVSVEMEKTITKKLQEKMKTMDFVPELEDKMIVRIKKEVAAELSMKESSMIDSIVDKVIRRVVAEPVTVQPSKTKSK
jgi:signal recognition particle GTPase